MNARLSSFVSARVATAAGLGARSRRSRAAGAFSLIEIMVAVSILAFMIVGLLAMFFHVQRAFRVGVTQSDVMEGGRAFLGTLTRELQTIAAPPIAYLTNMIAVPSPGTGAWGESSRQDLPSGSARTNYLQDIAFLTEDNGEWKGIAYRIDNRDGVGLLQRLEMTLPYESNPFFATNNLQNFTEKFFTSTISTNYRPILDGVVHLFVTAYDTNGLIYSSAWLRGNGGYGFTNHVHPPPNDLTFTNSTLPAYLDIELGILEPAATTRFRANADVNAANGQNYLRRQVGRTHLFRQRVSIRPAATRITDEF
jgi:hypothetical protein